MSLPHTIKLEAPTHIDAEETDPQETAINHGPGYAWRYRLRLTPTADVEPIESGVLVYLSEQWMLATTDMKPYPQGRVMDDFSLGEPEFKASQTYPSNEFFEWSDTDSSRHLMWYVLGEDVDGNHCTGYVVIHQLAPQ